MHLLKILPMQMSTLSQGFQTPLATGSQMIPQTLTVLSILQAAWNPLASTMLSILLCARNSLASTVLFILLSARNPPAFTVIFILPSASDPLVPQPTLKTSLALQPTPKASLGDTKVNKLTGNSTKPDGSNDESASSHNSQADTKDAPCTLLFKNTKGKQRRQTF